MRSSLMYRSAGSTFLVDASEDRMDCGRGRPDMVAVTERPQSSVGRCCNQPAQRTAVCTRTVSTEAATDLHAWRLPWAHRSVCLGMCERSVQRARAAKAQLLQTASGSIGAFRLCIEHRVRGVRCVLFDRESCTDACGGELTARRVG